MSINFFTCCFHKNTVFCHCILFLSFFLSTLFFSMFIHLFFNFTSAYKNCFELCPLPNATSFNHNSLHHVLTTVGIIVHAIAEGRLPSSSMFLRVPPANFNSNDKNNRENSTRSENNENDHDDQKRSKKESNSNRGKNKGDVESQEGSNAAYHFNFWSREKKEVFQDDEGEMTKKSTRQFY